MLRKKICLLLCAVMFITVFTVDVPKEVGAQVTEEWVARYNSPGNYPDDVNDIAVDSSGNVYVTGGLCLPYNDPSDYITVKYDSYGNELWVRRYDGPANKADYAFALALDQSGNVYVTGRSDGSNTHSDYATVKYDPDGNELWVARYNGPENMGDQAFAIAIDSSGKVYVTGKSTGIGTKNDYATVAYDYLGNELWVARYNGPGNHDDSPYTHAISLDSVGNVYVTGHSTGSETDWDYATIKYDAFGNQLWVARYNGPGNETDYATSIVIDDSGNVFVTGASSGGSTDFDYATIKYDSEGNEIWVQRYNGPGNGNDNAYAIVLDSFTNVYVTGYSYGGVTQGDFATLKYDSDGNELWVARYDESGTNENALDMAIDSLGNIYVTGFSGTAPNTDYATVKYDPSGNLLWVAKYNGPGNSSDSAQALTIDSSKNVYVTGNSFVISSSDDFATIKYSQQEIPVQPTIDIDPDTLNLDSRGRWITAYITLNSPYNVNNIDINSVMLEDIIPAEWGDIQNDTLMVKFDRSDVEDYIGTPQEKVELTITGKLMDGTQFSGSDTIRAILPGR